MFGIVKIVPYYVNYTYDRYLTVMVHFPNELLEYLYNICIIIDSKEITNQYPLLNFLY